MQDLSLSNEIEAVAVVVQGLVDAEFAKTVVVTPGSALDQVGLKDGLLIVRVHLKYGEFGVAFDHVLYMIREVDLSIPPETYVIMRRAARAMKSGEEELKAVKVSPGAG